jgi:hypothetical protein
MQVVGLTEFASIAAEFRLFVHQTRNLTPTARVQEIKLQERDRYSLPLLFQRLAKMRLLDLPYG